MTVRSLASLSLADLIHPETLFGSAVPWSRVRKWQAAGYVTVVTVSKHAARVSLTAHGAGQLDAPGKRRWDQAQAGRV
jgi:hypothetical protein